MYCIYPACCNSAIKHRQSICKYYTYSHYCAIKDTSVFVHTSEMVKCYNCHHLTHRSCTCCNNAQHKCIKYRFSKYCKYNKIEYKFCYYLIYKFPQKIHIRTDKHYTNHKIIPVTHCKYCCISKTSAYS